MDGRPTECCLKTPSSEEVSAILRAATPLKMIGYRVFAIKYLETRWPLSMSSVFPISNRSCAV
ncbi:hypothetical protein HYDPIDRAFT_107115, partial [Hydnomerulius pinastri MD-312]